MKAILVPQGLVDQRRGTSKNGLSGRRWRTCVFFAAASASMGHTHKHRERVGDAFTRRLLCQFSNEPNAAGILLWGVRDEPRLGRMLRVRFTLNTPQVPLFVDFLKPSGSAERADYRSCACGAACYASARQGRRPPCFRLHFYFASPNFTAAPV